ncbi:MAG: ATP-binding protein [Saprospiraceae bacterium]|nr:ATP-binding protein [Saprospiraceae bacterium]
MKEIIVTGPECSGKTTLARALSVRLPGILVPEISRSLLTLTNNNYKERDLVTIARYQQFVRSTARITEKEWLVNDTGLLVIKVWSEFRFGKTDPFIDEGFYNTEVDLWLLCEPLQIWEDDGLRVNKNEREVLFSLYHDHLIQSGKPFKIVPAISEERRLNWTINCLSKI